MFCNMPFNQFEHHIDQHVVVVLVFRVFFLVILSTMDCGRKVYSSASCRSMQHEQNAVGENFDKNVFGRSIKLTIESNE
jgi:hypothetical protein